MMYLTNHAAKKLASRINEDAVTKWLHADDNVPTIHHYTDSESLHIVISTEKNGNEEESSGENEENVRERISIDRLSMNYNNFQIQYIHHKLYSQDTKQKIQKFRKS